MKCIRDIYAARRATRRPVISFEFFTPRTDEGDETLLGKTIPALAAVKPDYFSVTYGAGGSTRDKTLTLVDRMQREHGVTTMSHVTCVNSTREQIGAFLDAAQARGIGNILALRGDPPGGGDFVKTPGGFEFSSDLVLFVRERGGFSIGVAGFPEGHMACKEGKFVDWDRLKRKIDAGADFVLTQVFYDNACFYEFYDHMLSKLRVTVPVCPGVLPIFATAQIKRITELCGATLPPALVARLQDLENQDDAVAALGIEYATRQCEGLLKLGVPGLHFCTLNRRKSAVQVLRNLGLAERSMAKSIA